MLAGIFEIRFIWQKRHLAARAFANMVIYLPAKTSAEWTFAREGPRATCPIRDIHQLVNLLVGTFVRGPFASGDIFQWVHLQWWMFPGGTFASGEQTLAHFFLPLANIPSGTQPHW